MIHPMGTRFPSQSGNRLAPCECNHVKSLHGLGPKGYKGRKKCQVVGCDCRDYAPTK